MKFFIAALLGLSALYSQASQAGELVTNATIKGIANTNNNLPGAFVVYLNGGTGICANISVLFRKGASGDDDRDQFNRTYALALMAFASGKKVMIHNYANNSCEGTLYLNVSQ